MLVSLYNLTLSFFYNRHSTDREVALMMLMAYLSYMLAEVPLTNFYIILIIYFSCVSLSFNFCFITFISLGKIMMPSTSRKYIQKYQNSYKVNFYSICQIDISKVYSKEWKGKRNLKMNALHFIILSPLGTPLQ